TDIAQVAAGGGQYSPYVDNSNDGGYYPVQLNAGLEDTIIHLQDIAASLVDIDGSETLAIRVADIPVGAVLSDGSNSFAATGGNTSVTVSSWSLDTLTITPPQHYNGTFTLNVSAISTEATNGSQALASLPMT